jgi:hypothetical protein
MARFCVCTAGGENLGQSVCDAILMSANKMLFKEKLNADGSVAGIDFSTSPFNQSAWDAYLQATPLKNRYLLGDGVDDYSFEMNEREAVETANAVSYKVRDGHIDVTYNIFGTRGASTRLFQKYKALECLNLGINIIDDKGQVAGVEDGNNLRLIPIDSLQVRYGAQQNSGQIAHVIVTFRIPHTFDFGTVRLYQAGTADVNPLDLRPIINLEGEFATTPVALDTTLDVKIGVDSAKFGFDPYVGMGVSNFTVTVDGSPNVVTAVAETADGRYTLTLTSALSSAEVVVVNAVLSGYEMSPLTDTIA